MLHIPKHCTHILETPPPQAARHRSILVICGIDMEGDPTLDGTTSTEVPPVPLRPLRSLHLIHFSCH